ncbi:MAG: response regulator transcription factor [Spirochaetales bacterium]|uniref:Response regulator transcription factor n=1 Tax=Candidatus Thalassospirochaeta sargassi TaxID=3119039 RepID=A0AAJ1IFR4_9SPIO|nr:response regulator transcription factor [Spirochaetales bacterium]
MKILIIEDDAAISGFISKGLKEAGFFVECFETGEDGLAAVSEGFDAAVIDIMLPGIDGLSVIEQLRGSGYQLPILVLSAKRSVDDRVAGLQRGGDDYMVKPFSFSELLARLRALLRRSAVKKESSAVEAFGIRLDPVTREVSRDGESVALNPKEFSLLEYLVRNQGMVMSKTMIMEHIWGYDFDPQTNVVDVLVSRLRSKIDKESDRKLIHTIRGVGYVLREKN